MHFSNFAESGVLNHIFRSSTLAKPVTMAVALTGIVPNDANTAASINEISGGSYARVDLGAPADADWNAVILDSTGGSGLMDNVAAVTFPQATANWGWVSGIALVDTTSGSGNMWMYGQLTTPREILNNDTFEIPAGSLDIYLS